MRAWRRCARILNDRIEDFLNVVIYYRGGRIDVRVIDVVLLIGGVGSIAWYGYIGGWLGALQAGAFYLFIVLCMLWFFPSDKKMK